MVYFGECENSGRHSTDDRNVTTFERRNYKTMVNVRTCQRRSNYFNKFIFWFSVSLVCAARAVWSSVYQTKERTIFLPFPQKFLSSKHNSNQGWQSRINVFCVPCVVNHSKLLFFVFQVDISERKYNFSWPVLKMVWIFTAVLVIIYTVVKLYFERRSHIIDLLIVKELEKLWSDTDTYWMHAITSRALIAW